MNAEPLSKVELIKLIKKGSSLLSLTLSATQIDQCVSYINEIERWNNRVNLVKATGKTLVIKHLFDSLAGISAFLRADPQGSIYDIGSGAGFPGIPLAICMPDTVFILAERVGKKAVFLQNMILLSGLKNVRVFSHDFRDIDKKADIITFRAFSAMDKVLADMSRLLNPGGCIIAYKGQREKIDEELRGMENKTRSIEVKKIAVPFLENERHVVIIKP